MEVTCDLADCSQNIEPLLYRETGFYPLFGDLSFAVGVCGQMVGSCPTRMLCGERNDSMWEEMPG